MLYGGRSIEQEYIISRSALTVGLVSSEKSGWSMRSGFIPIWANYFEELDPDSGEIRGGG